MIYILGANGQLGQEFKKNSFFKDASFIDSTIVDLSNLTQLEDFLKNTKFKTLINAAAYTQVDKAESEKKIASAVNTDAPALIAKYAENLKFKFLHFSTDYVFNGKSSMPYIETDKTEPVNFYGSTKLSSEQAIENTNPSALVIRTSWLYSKHGHNFVNTMTRYGKEKPKLRVVFDQVGTPTNAEDLVTFSQLALSENLQGLFHFSNEGVASWYDFAIQILKLQGIDIAVEPIRSADYPTPAARPNFSVLDKGKIKSALSQKIPYWIDSLERSLKS